MRAVFRNERAIRVATAAEGVDVKAYLIDPQSLAVVWMNESAGQAALLGKELPAPLGQVFPVADALGVREALVTVASGGEPQHLQANLVSTNKGTMMLVASLYRLPDGHVLVLVDQSWQGKRSVESGPPRRPRR